jgi:hypothetical protein
MERITQRCSQPAGQPDRVIEPHRLLLSQGHAAAAAPTGRFHWALRVSGLTALAAVPVTFVLIRRVEIAWAVAASMQPAAQASAPVR